VGAEKKRSPSNQGRRYIAQSKKAILDYYLFTIIASKVALPPHTYDAYHSFIMEEVTEEDMNASIRPAMEKMLLRSPEVSLPPVESFFIGYIGDVAPHLIALRPLLLSAAKSSSATTRANAISLFRWLFDKMQDQDEDDEPIIFATVKEILAQLKGGKTTSPDQRASLFTLLGRMTEEAEYSRVIVDEVSSLLAKETQELALKGAFNALVKHLSWCLCQDIFIGTKVTQAVCKELNNPKVPLRKIACTAVGNIIQALGSKVKDNQAAIQFGESLLPSLEINLKTASTNTLTSPSGPLEGYVAAASLEGKMAYWGSAKIDNFLKKDTILQSLTIMTPKPSFLLNEKVVRKIATPEEEEWLMESLGAILVRRAAVFKEDEAARAAASQVILQMILVRKPELTWKLGATVLEDVAITEPRLVCSLVQESIMSCLYAKEAQAGKLDVQKANIDREEGVVKVRGFSRELMSLLQAPVRRTLRYFD
jgi:hypothetical protein